MLPQQKYAVYNNRNVSKVLILAQDHKNMINTITNMQKSVDQTSPKRYSHVKFFGNPYDRKRKFEIDSQNQKLLGKIMQIMKRKNKSVQQARAAPERIVGGADALLNRYDASHSFRNAVAEHSYSHGNYNGPPSPSKANHHSLLSNREL